MSAVSIPAQPVKQKRSMKGRIIGALGLLVVAAIVAVGSGANFTAHTANPGNMVTEGAFSLSNSINGQAIFASQTNWDPSETETGYVNIGNAGNEPGNFTVSGTKEAGDDEFMKNIQIVVTDYSGDNNTVTNPSDPNRPPTGYPVRSDGISYSGSLYHFINGCAGLTDSDTSTPGMQSSETLTYAGDPNAKLCNVNRSYGANGWTLSNWNGGETHYYKFKLTNFAKDGDGNDPAVAQFFGKTAKFGVNWDAVSTA